MGKAVTDCACPNAQCAMFGKIGKGNIVLHGFLKLKRGRRRRYRCEACGRTFVSSVGTPYHRLKCTRAQFDRVAALSVEGMSKSGIARVMHLSWNTVARWLQRAAEAAERFSDRVLRGYMLTELQADEIRTFIDSKKRVQWVLAAIEVWSRLWVSLVLGRRSYRNVRRLLADAFHRGECGRIPLITTDGNRYYRIVLGRLFGRGCIHGRIVKTFRKGRVSKVERDLSIGSEWQLEEALLYSEDSDKLNTSFVERLNLTIRQGSAYLRRRSPAHARQGECLAGQLELLRCYYNFVRPHMALKFGREIRTPAMQAGLVGRRLTFRDIFTAVAEFLRLMALAIRVRCRRQGLIPRSALAL
jgi:transposase-like protein/IS1 family transposase